MGVCMNVWVYVCCVGVCMYGFCNVWLCVCVGILVICVLVYTVFLYCFVYVYLFLFVTNVRTTATE
jgi:hypothetical protein